MENIKSAHVAILLACVLAGCSKPTEPMKAANTTIQEPPAKVAPNSIQVANTAEPATVTADDKKNPKADRYSATYNNCMGAGDAADGVTSAMLDCIGAEISVQDHLLNASYQSVMAKLTDQPSKDKLRSDERRWIKARDAKCTAEAEPEEGGSLATVIYNNCILDATIDRSQEISRM